MQYIQNNYLIARLTTNKLYNRQLYFQLFLSIQILTGLEADNDVINIILK